jgi:hypothetical protein
VRWPGLAKAIYLHFWLTGPPMSFQGGACVDYATDENNCGACGTVCPEVSSSRSRSKCACPELTYLRRPQGNTCSSGVCTRPCTQAELDTGRCALSLIRNGGEADLNSVHAEMACRLKLTLAFSDFQTRDPSTGRPDPWVLGSGWGYNPGRTSLADTPRVLSNRRLTLRIL